MANTSFRGTPVRVSGELPPKGAKAPPLSLVRADLSDVTLDAFAGKRKVLNIFPSIDTGVCQKSVHEFTKRASGREGVAILNISADLPFAGKRWCGAEGLDAEVLSTFRSTFATDYGLRLEEGGMKGLCARAVIVLDAENNVVHTELVDDIVHEPNYDAALAALG